MQEGWHKWLDPKHEKLHVIEEATCCMDIKIFSKHEKKKRVREKPDALGATVADFKVSKILT